MLEWLRSMLCSECRQALGLCKLSTDVLEARARNSETMLTSEREKNKEMALSLEEANRLIAYLQPEPPVSVPSWIDSTMYAIKPTIQVIENGRVMTVSINPQDIYARSPTLDRVVREQGWKYMQNDERLQAIWAYVANRITYRFDAGESWEYPTTTWFRQSGDCEDGTILFVTFARMSGIPADMVFNAAGYFKTSDGMNVGHSYPIAKKSDGKWYIYESTLDSVGLPKIFMGSNYDASWGVANDKFCGGIKNGMQI